MKPLHSWQFFELVKQFRASMAYVLIKIKVTFLICLQFTLFQLPINIVETEGADEFYQNTNLSALKVVPEGRWQLEIIDIFSLVSNRNNSVL